MKPWNIISQKEKIFVPPIVARAYYIG